MAPSTNSPVAAGLLKERDKIERATEVIQHDPEAALATLERAGAVATPDAGEITQADMFRLMSQMQQQMAGMQSQIIELMSGKLGANTPTRTPDSKAEIAQDQLQRDMTLKSWNEEPREPVFIHPDQDEDKIHAITGAYTPRVFRVNGLEYPVDVGQIAHVPSSIARLIEYTQRRRPLSGPPQGLPLIADPQVGKFLASSISQTIGNPGKAGEGQIYPDVLPPPQPLGLKYDHNGQ